LLPGSKSELRFAFGQWSPLLAGRERKPPSRYRIFHKQQRSSRLQSCLFEDAVQSSRGKIVIRMPRQCDASWFHRVLVLPMTSACLFQKPAIPLQQLDDISYLHGENSYLGGCSYCTAGHASGNQPQRMVSIKVTLLISFRVVNPPRTLSRADSRRKRMPSSRAAFRISEVGLFSRIISRMRSVKSRSS